MIENAVEVRPRQTTSTVVLAHAFHSRSCPPALAWVCAALIATCLALTLDRLHQRQQPFQPGSWAEHVVQTTPVALASTTDTWRRSTGSPAAAAPPEQIDWFRGRFVQADRVAQLLDRPVLLFLYARDDPRSIHLHREFLAAAEVRTAARDLLCFAADVGTPRGRQLVQRFGAASTPTLMLYRPGTGAAWTVRCRPAGFAATVAEFVSATGVEAEAEAR